MRIEPFKHFLAMNTAVIEAFKLNGHLQLYETLVCTLRSYGLAFDNIGIGILV